MIPHPSQAMLSAMREHLELASIPISREKMDRMLVNAWRAAEKVRQAEDDLLTPEQRGGLRAAAASLSADFCAIFNGLGPGTEQVRQAEQRKGGR